MNEEAGKATAEESGGIFQATNAADNASVAAAFEAAQASHGRGAHLGKLRRHRPGRKDGGQGACAASPRHVRQDNRGRSNRDLYVISRLAARAAEADEIDGEGGIIVNTAFFAAFEGQIGREVKMGTRFCAAAEAPIGNAVNQFLVANDERDMKLTSCKFHNTGRVARNSISERVVEISGAANADFDHIRPIASGMKGCQSLETGDLDAGLIWADQFSGLIHEMPTFAHLAERILGDAADVIASCLAKLFD